MWLQDIEDSALQQAIDLSSLPFAYRHIAIMPDAHAGLGMPIGGVLATKNVIVPNAVGVDIGCGMCAVKTNIEASSVSKNTLKNIIGDIRELIPSGFDHQLEKQDESLLPQNHNIEELPNIKNLYSAALKQIGTLGGGNHFIELQTSTENVLWVMIHSGSRNVGLKIAEYYGKKAKKLNQMWFSEIVKGLEFLPIGTNEATAYIKEMRFCVDFAFANRKAMMNVMCETIDKHIKNANFEPMINIAHNYAAWEEHFGEKVIVHRKGATRAFAGEIGIIPGSQGSSSYIVEGLGNPDSFMSCSHGAGRTMGRKEAIRRLDLEEEVRKMDEKGIVHSMRNKRDLDEAPSAYKDIDEVMRNQADLVKPIVKLKPLAVYKSNV